MAGQGRYREPLIGPNEGPDDGLVMGHSQTAVECSSSSSSGSDSPDELVSDDSDEGEKIAGSVAVDRWKKAGNVVRKQARLKLTMEAMVRRAKEHVERRKSCFFFKLFMLVVTLSVLDTETKAVVFHLSAVGIYSPCTLTSTTGNGINNTFDRSVRYGDITSTEQDAYEVSSCQPYKFSYSLFVTLSVFLVKLTLGPLKAMVRNREKINKHKMEDQRVRKETSERQMETHGSEVSSRRTGSRRPSRVGTGHGRTSETQAMTVTRAFRKLRMFTQLASSAKAKVMPWVLLFGFTFMEMLSTSLANYALNLTPTSIYIVFKSSKMVFVAIASRLFLGTKLRWAQWSALVLLVLALLVSVVAEKAPSKQGGHTLRGPMILLASEMCHALMLVMQQVAVQSYWPEPMMLVSASAALGMPMTIFSMFAAHRLVTPYPPHHPVSDWRDVFAMCSTSMTLSVALVSHMVFHVAMDVNHITALRHMSSLTRSLCDAVKLGAMWTIGKLCWFAGDFIWQADWPSSGGVLAVIAEPWHPHSWMMIPGLIMIAYAMLMFKFAVFVPIRFEKSDDGTWHAKLSQNDEAEDGKHDPFQKVDVGWDDDFYSAAFTDRQCRQVMKKTRHVMRKQWRLAFLADGAKPANRFQAALVKIKTNEANSAGGVPAGDAR